MEIGIKTLSLGLSTSFGLSLSLSPYELQSHIETGVSNQDLTSGRKSTQALQHTILVITKN